MWYYRLHCYCRYARIYMVQPLKRWGSFNSDVATVSILGVCWALLILLEVFEIQAKGLGLCVTSRHTDSDTSPHTDTRTRVASHTSRIRVWSHARAVGVILCMCARSVANRGRVCTSMSRRVVFVGGSRARVQRFVLLGDGYDGF